MLIQQLLQPFGYLSIRHPYKWIVDWFYPAFISIAVVLALVLNDSLSNLLKTGNGGFVPLALSFVQSLPGFYIAALAAVATFGRSDIDSVLPEPTPKIKIKFRDKENIVELTRRRFLAMLFAFLTAESIIIVIYSIVLSTYGETLFQLTPPLTQLANILPITAATIYFLFLSQMILATFWGLYYLGYKLHE